jgi:hypothetical protein
MVADDDGGATGRYRTRHGCCAATKETRERNHSAWTSAFLLGLWDFRVSPDLLTHYSRGSHPSDHRFRKPQVIGIFEKMQKWIGGSKIGNLVYGWWCSGELWEHKLGFHPTSIPIIPEGPPIRSSSGSETASLWELWEHEMSLTDDVVGNFGNILWNNHSCQARSTKLFSFSAFSCTAFRVCARGFAFKLL